MKKEILEALKNDLETTFKEQAEAGEVYLMAASSADEDIMTKFLNAAFGVAEKIVCR